MLQARCNAVDGQVNAALHPLVILTLAVAANQLHLQMVQRVDVGKAVAHRARQRRVAGQAVFLARDLGQRIHCAMPFF